MKVDLGVMSNMALELCANEALDVCGEGVKVAVSGRRVDRRLVPSLIGELHFSGGSARNSRYWGDA